MKRLLIKFCLFNCLLIFCIDVCAQNDLLKIDSLKKALLRNKDDTVKVNTYLQLSQAYFSNYDILNSQKNDSNALFLSQRTNFKTGEIKSLINLAFKSVINDKPDYLNAMYNFSTAMKIAKEINNKAMIADCLSGISLSYAVQRNYSEALKFQLSELKLREELKDSNNLGNVWQGIGATYSSIKNYNESTKSYRKALTYLNEKKNGFEIGLNHYCIGDNYFETGKYDEAANEYYLSAKILDALNNNDAIAAVHERIGIINEYYGDRFNKQERKKADSFYSIARDEYNIALMIWVTQKRERFKAELLGKIGNIYLKLGNKSLSKKYLDSALQMATTYYDKQTLSAVYYHLSQLDSASGNFGNAYENYKKYNFYKDSLNIDEDIRKGENYKLQNEFEQKETLAKAEQQDKDEKAKRIKTQQYFAIAALGIVVLAVVVIALIQFRNNKHKQQANIVLQKQKEKVEATLAELKTTQTQLIQSEKMASLGELTAGIAHEIQNPLNFVNNFSDVNKEMLMELNEEIDKGNYDDAKSIAHDVIANEEKINHHGKRAEAIVKGMLQHSRKSEGKKESTDINVLCDEYLRLSYHGMKAKDKAFNADIPIAIGTDFDETIGKINVVPQDIGRVLLNLFNNAFYAVNEKQKLMANSYQPTAEVKTRRINDKVEITVSDNGNGIPSSIIDKIFQPFFTTKPTGQGTGLGLSLAYDIITQEHNGTIKVESKEGEGSKFIIQLPIN